MKDMYVERDCTTNQYAYKGKVIETYKGVCLSLKYEGHYYGEGLYNTQVYAHKEKDIVMNLEHGGLEMILKHNWDKRYQTKTKLIMFNIWSRLQEGFITSSLELTKIRLKKDTNIDFL